MNAILFIPLMIGTTEIVVLAGLALLLFGGKKLPGLMKNMGQGVREFKDGMAGASDEFKKGMDGQQTNIQDEQEEADKSTDGSADMSNESQDNGKEQQ